MLRVKKEYVDNTVIPLLDEDEKGNVTEKRIELSADTSQEDLSLLWGNESCRVFLEEEATEGVVVAKPSKGVSEVATTTEAATEVVIGAKQK